MGYETDERFDPARFRGAPQPRRYSKGRDGSASLAVRKAAFEEGERKNQYQHKVVVAREPTARE